MATINQSAQNVPESTEGGWQELTNNNGEKFMVKAENYDISAQNNNDAVAASGPPFDNLRVGWNPNNEGVTTEEVQETTGITYWKLQKSPWWNKLFQWQLTISTRDTYHYYFTDASGHVEDLNVYQNAGTHWISWNSPNPEVVLISGR